MCKPTVRARMLRAALALAVGGSAFQLSGCDPAVRDELINGFETTAQALSATLISAFFLGLQDGDSSSDGFTTSG